MYVPLDVLLSFPAPNYVNPERRGNGLVAANALFISILTVAISLRYYARIRMQKWFGWDDAFMGLAFLSVIGYTAGIILAYQQYHWDRHVWDIPVEKIESAVRLAFAIKLMFAAAISLTRVSLLCFYYRLVRNSNLKWFQWTLHASMAYIVIVGLLTFFLSLFACRPIQAYWMFPEPPGSKCMSDDASTLGLGIVNCTADLLVTIFPIPLVLKLQMPTRQRISIAVLLSLGLNVTIAGAVRTYFIWEALFTSWDTTWHSYPLWIAATVEVDLAVVCACAPAIRPLFTRTFLRSLSSRLRSIIPPSLKVTSASPSTDASRSFKRLPEGKYSESASRTDRKSTSTVQLRALDASQGRSHHDSEESSDEYRITGEENSDPGIPGLAV